MSCRSSLRKKADLSRPFSSLDSDAELFHVAQRRELGDADLDPRRFEFTREDVGDRFAGSLEQREVLLLEQLPDAVDDAAVIDGVGDVVAFRRMPAGQTDFEIELYRLRHLLFPLVDADQGFDIISRT